MRTFKIPLVLLACLGSTFAAQPPETIRTVKDIPGFPLTVLKRTISPTLYGHLLASPVDGWIAVRGQLTGSHLSGVRVIHSELGGAYDKYALQLARDWRIAGHYGIDKLSPTTPVVVNVLIYQIADGTMALSLPCFDEAGGNQLEYYGSAKLAVQQIDGHWTDLKLPEGPLGKVWAVCSGVRNSFALEMKLQQISP